MFKIKAMKYIQSVKKGPRVHHYFVSPTGFRVTMPPLDTPEARVVYEAALTRYEQDTLDNISHKQRHSNAEQAKKENAFYARMAARMRHRATLLSVPCELTSPDLKAISASQGHRCHLTGIPFVLRQSERGRGSPFAPSPDRISSSLGYVLGNVRMVCQMANYARLDFSDEEFYRMCEAAHLWRKKQAKNRNAIQTL